MRAFFLALLMANLVFFAWAQGYLGDTGSGHEPQRLAEQLRPETMQLLRQLPPARDEDTAGCKRVENLTDRKSTRLNSSHIQKSRMPSSA